MGKPPIEDEYKDIPDRRKRYRLRHPDKIKEIQKRYDDKRRKAGVPSPEQDEGEDDS